MTLDEYIKNNKPREIDIISSYHNHNYLCRHANGRVCDYVLRASQVGIKYLGISDHGPLPDISDRMDYRLFISAYLPQFNIDTLGVTLYKGLEMEYEYGMDDYYKELLTHVDYLILGQHNVYTYGTKRPVHVLHLDDNDFIEYKNSCIKALRTGMFSIFAHPDIMFYNTETISRVGLECLEAVVKEAVDLDIPLEVNANGLRRAGIGKIPYKYPRQEYLDLLKKYNARVIVSDDAHNPLYIYDDKTKLLYGYLIDEGFNLDFNPKIVK